MGTIILSRFWWAAALPMKREWWWIYGGARRLTVRARVLDRFDHGNLNLDPLFADRVPTTENFCRSIFDLLQDGLPVGELEHVRVEETENNFFECSAKG